MGITAEGIQGEQMLFKLLRSLGFTFFQPDAIGIKGNDNYIFECKHQERFVAPPFDGHGLPKWQVKRRMEFQERTGIKSILIVFDKATGEIFYQTLENLEKGKHFDTNGGKPRRVYDLNSFKKFSVVSNNAGATYNTASV